LLHSASAHGKGATESLLRRGQQSIRRPFTKRGLWKKGASQIFLGEPRQFTPTDFWPSTFKDVEARANLALGCSGPKAMGVKYAIEGKFSGRVQGQIRGPGYGLNPQQE